MDFSTWPEIRRNLRKVALILMGFFLLYSVFYFLFVKPTLPPSQGFAAKYLAQVQQGHWDQVEKMHVSRQGGEKAVKDWRRIETTFGPIQSFQPEFNREMTFPGMTRSWLVYKLSCPKGDVEAFLNLQPRWSLWRVKEARVFFRPPMPFTNPTG